MAPQSPSPPRLLTGGARWRGAFAALYVKGLRLFFRRPLINCLLFAALPLLLVFVIGLGRLGLPASTTLGVGPASPIPLTFPAKPGQVLAFADATTSGSGIPASVAASVAAASGVQLVTFATHDDLLAACAIASRVAERPPPCFAGLTFADVSAPATAAANVTITYPSSSVPYAADVAGLGPLGKAGILSLQLAVERGVVGALSNGTLAPALSAAVTAAQPFTTMTRAEFNTAFYGYFYDFIAQTGAAACVVIFLPHVAWLVSAVAGEAELGIRDVLLVAGLPRAAYLATFLAIAATVFAPFWLLLAVLLQQLIFASSSFASVLLLLVLTGCQLMTLSLALAQAFRRAYVAGVASIVIVFVMGCVGLGAAVSGSAGAQAAAAVLLGPAGMVIGITDLARAEEDATPLNPADWYSQLPALGGGLPFGVLLALQCVNVVVNVAVTAVAVSPRAVLTCGGARCCASRQRRDGADGKGGHGGGDTHAGWPVPIASPVTGLLPPRVLSSTTDEPTAVAAAGAGAVLYEPSDDVSEAGGGGSTGVAVRLRGLRKVFHGGPRGMPPAVAGLSMDLRYGQVLCLLGRNGCGKSTTINMLTGVHAPSAGSAAFYPPAGALSGGSSAAAAAPLDLVRDLPAVRQTLGVCPQHDVLWPELTVSETLSIYAAVKGVPAEALAGEVDAWVRRIGLTEKHDTPVHALSGGQKRRVSLATAFIGGSSVVLLDEPSSGVDPSSRRALWEVITASATPDRAILLTTHFLDEADILAHRVALMARGQLLALGAPAALKRRVGLGYFVTGTLTAAAAAATASGGADGDDGADSGAPAASAAAGSSAALAVLRCARGIVPGARLHSHFGRDVVVELPQEASPALPALLRRMEASAAALGLQAVGVSSASMQDLFLGVVGKAEADADAAAAAGAARDEPAAVTVTHSLPLLTTAPAGGGGRALPPVPSSGVRLAALLRNRALLAYRDPLVLGLPAVLVTVMAAVLGGAFRGTSFSDCPQTLLVATSPSSVTASASGPPPYGGGLSLVDALVPPAPVSLPPASLVTAPSAAAALSALAVNGSAYFGALLPYTGGGGGGGSPAWPDVTVAFNLLVPYADATSLNALNNALWRAATGGNASAPAAVATSLQPFPAAASPAATQDVTPLFVLLFVVLVCWAFLAPLLSTVPLTRERLLGAKAQQRVSGVPAHVYWGAHLLFDAAALVPCALVVAGALVGGVPAWAPDYGLTFLLLWLSGVGSVLVGYAVSFAAPSTTVALLGTAGPLFLVAVGFFAGVLTQLSGGTTAAEIARGNVMTVVTYVGMAVDPLTSLMVGVMLGTNTVLLACGAPLDGPSLWAYAQLGRPLALLAGQAAVVAALVLLLESWPALQLRRRAAATAAADAPVKGGVTHAHAGTDGESGSGAGATVVAPQPAGVDEDVAAEAAAVDVAEAAAVVTAAAGGHHPYGAHHHGGEVRIAHLRRQFGGDGGLLAVADLSLQLPAGEAFALLGANGAGKTTALRSVCGLDVPTSGSVTVAGHSLLHDSAGVQRSVGVTPQFDVLYPSLSAWDHLRFYGALRGLAGGALEAEAAWLIDALDLGAVARKPSGALSGGNRRKLSVALALIGSPPVVILDEPSTGCDAITKRHLWRVLRALRSAGTTLVLVTHAMEEVEAVAERVGVMAAGRLVALGSVQRLKSRYGADVQVDAEAATAAGAGALAATLLGELPGAAVVQQHGAAVRLRVPTSAVPFPALFERLAALRAEGAVAAFTVTQTSLDAIFVRLTADAGERAPPPVLPPDALGGRGSAPYWGVPLERFTTTVWLYLLLVSPATSVFWAGLLACLLGATWMTAVVPPLARGLAVPTRGVLRAALRSERWWQRRMCLLPDPTTVGPNNNNNNTNTTARRLYGAAFVELHAPGARSALVYVAVIKPGLAVGGALYAGATLLLVGGASVFTAWPTACILVRRYAVWQRRFLGRLPQHV